MRRPRQGTSMARAAASPTAIALRPRCRGGAAGGRNLGWGALGFTSAALTRSDVIHYAPTPYVSRVSQSPLNIVVAHPTIRKSRPATRYYPTISCDYCHIYSPLLTGASDIMSALGHELFHSGLQRKRIAVPQLVDRARCSRVVVRRSATSIKHFKSTTNAK